MRHLFDVRNIIGALLGIYGVVLTIAGFAPGLLGDHRSSATDNPVDLYVGTDANWWVGLALIVVAVVFFAWAALRPVADEVVEAAVEEAQEPPTSTSA